MRYYPQVASRGRRGACTGMSYYRLFFMREEGGPILGSEEILARDDVEAVHIASRRVGAEAVEVWCEKRKVKHFEALPAPVGPARAA